MKEKIIKIYSFKELNKQAKEDAINNNREINLDDGFSLDCSRDNWKEKLAKYGFNDASINYDISYCQGSGASFDTKDIDFFKLLEYLKNKKYDILKKFIEHGDIELDISITENGYATHYCHKFTRYTSIEFSNYVDYDYDIEKDLKIDFPELYNSYRYKIIVNDEKGISDLFQKITEKLEILVDELEKDIEEVRQNLCDEIYKEFKKEYEYLGSEEAIIETLIANDYEFDEEGNTI